MAAKKLLNKADIFAAAKKGLEPQTVTVDEWGGDVIYKPMTMTERRQVRKKAVEMVTDNTGDTTAQVDTELLEVHTVLTCVLDPADEGRKKLLFGPEDIPVLEEQMASGGISTVAQAILKASGMVGNATFRGEEKAES